ncbi:hypothetical protein LJR289_001557 [Pseudoduganella sp. LjRoot289]|uniref:hypothetical protein n=1 Tax=Pseudoduganella sp. LjRoot289 TaxID=3342314 RepID=UPI003ECF600B
MRPTSIAHRLLLAIGLLCAAAAPLRAEVAPPIPLLLPIPLAAPAEPAEATGLEWLEQHDTAFLAANSFSNGYLTAHGFSKVHDNDALAARLHLPRNDPDLAANDPYGPYPLRTSDELDPALLGLAALGMATAAVSGILLYARDPISRKRKYRRSSAESQQFAV